MRRFPLGPAPRWGGAACRKSATLQGEPISACCAGQKFFPPGSLALSRFSRRATAGACENRSAAPAAPSLLRPLDALGAAAPWGQNLAPRSEEHTSELQSRFDLVCRLLLAKKNMVSA